MEALVGEGLRVDLPGDVPTQHVWCWGRRASSTLPPRSMSDQAQFQIHQCRLDRRLPQPARQVVDRDAVHQQLAGVRVSQRVVRYVTHKRYRPSSSALAAEAFIQRSAVALDALASLSSWPMLPNWSALVRAACISACIDTILALLPFPRRTRLVGQSASGDRCRASQLARRRS